MPCGACLRGFQRALTSTLCCYSDQKNDEKNETKESSRTKELQVNVCQTEEDFQKLETGVWPIGTEGNACLNPTTGFVCNQVQDGRLMVSSLQCNQLYYQDKQLSGQPEMSERQPHSQELSENSSPKLNVTRRLCTEQTAIVNELEEIRNKNGSGPISNDNRQLERNTNECSSKDLNVVGKETSRSASEQVNEAGDFACKESYSEIAEDSKSEVEIGKSSSLDSLNKRDTAQGSNQNPHNDTDTESKPVIEVVNASDEAATSASTIKFQQETEPGSKLCSLKNDISIETATSSVDNVHNGSRSQNSDVNAISSSQDIDSASSNMSLLLREMNNSLQLTRNQPLSQNGASQHLSRFPSGVFPFISGTGDGDLDDNWSSQTVCSENSHSNRMTEIDSAFEGFFSTLASNESHASSSDTGSNDVHEEGSSFLVPLVREMEEGYLLSDQNILDNNNFSNPDVEHEAVPLPGGGDFVPSWTHGVFDSLHAIDTLDVIPSFHRMIDFGAPVLESSNVYPLQQASSSLMQDDNEFSEVTTFPDVSFPSLPDAEHDELEVCLQSTRERLQPSERSLTGSSDTILDLSKSDVIDNILASIFDDQTTDASEGQMEEHSENQQCHAASGNQGVEGSCTTSKTETDLERNEQLITNTVYEIKNEGTAPPSASCDLHETEVPSAVFNNNLVDVVNEDYSTYLTSGDLKSAGISKGSGDEDQATQCLNQNNNLNNSTSRKFDLKEESNYDDDNVILTENTNKQDLSHCMSDLAVDREDTYVDQFDETTDERVITCNGEEYLMPLLKSVKFSVSQKNVFQVETTGNLHAEQQKQTEGGKVASGSSISFAMSEIPAHLQDLAEEEVIQIVYHDDDVNEDNQLLLSEGSLTSDSYMEHNITDATILEPNTENTSNCSDHNDTVITPLIEFREESVGDIECMKTNNTDSFELAVNNFDIFGCEEVSSAFSNNQDNEQKDQMQIQEITALPGVNNNAFEPLFQSREESTCISFGHKDAAVCEVNNIASSITEIGSQEETVTEVISETPNILEENCSPSKGNEDAGYVGPSGYIWKEETCKFSETEEGSIEANVPTEHFADEVTLQNELERSCNVTIPCNNACALILCNRTQSVDHAFADLYDGRNSNHTEHKGNGCFNASTQLCTTKDEERELCTDDSELQKIPDVNIKSVFDQNENIFSCQNTQYSHSNEKSLEISNDADYIKASQNEPLTGIPDSKSSENNMTVHRNASELEQNACISSTSKKQSTYTAEMEKNQNNNEWHKENVTCSPNNIQFCCDEEISKIDHSTHATQTNLLQVSCVSHEGSEKDSDLVKQEINQHFCSEEQLYQCDLEKMNCEDLKNSSHRHMSMRQHDQLTTEAHMKGNVQGDLNSCLSAELSESLVDDIKDKSRLLEDAKEEVEKYKSEEENGIIIHENITTDENKINIMDENKHFDSAVEYSKTERLSKELPKNCECNEVSGITSRSSMESPSKFDSSKEIVCEHKKNMNQTVLATSEDPYMLNTDINYNVHLGARSTELPREELEIQAWRNAPTCNQNRRFCQESIWSNNNDEYKRSEYLNMPQQCSKNSSYQKKILKCKSKSSTVIIDKSLAHSTSIIISIDQTCSKHHQKVECEMTRKKSTPYFTESHCKKDEDGYGSWMKNEEVHEEKDSSKKSRLRNKMCMLESTKSDKCMNVSNEDCNSDSTAARELSLRRSLAPVPSAASSPSLTDQEDLGISCTAYPKSGSNEKRMLSHDTDDTESADWQFVQELPTDSKSKKSKKLSKQKSSKNLLVDSSVETYKRGKKYEKEMFLKRKDSRNTKVLEQEQKEKDYLFENDPELLEVENLPSACGTVPKESSLTPANSRITYEGGTKVSSARSSSTNMERCASILKNTSGDNTFVKKPYLVKKLHWNEKVEIFYVNRGEQFMGSSSCTENRNDCVCHEYVPLTRSEDSQNNWRERRKLLSKGLACHPKAKKMTEAEKEKEKKSKEKMARKHRKDVAYRKSDYFLSGYSMELANHQDYSGKSMESSSDSD